jgi:sigma-54 dependent transcriptional regulator, acetoin dehydrogenase operon transcriptional activator AcoR
MSNLKLLDQDAMQREIKASHERSRGYGICRERRNPDQVCLSQAELTRRRREYSDFLDVAAAHIMEYSHLLSQGKFMMAIVDREGYILDMWGSEEMQEVLVQGNCTAGYRWTERDVGTSAISLCLERQIPVQLNDSDHYCRQAHGFTSSAAPVFTTGDALLGILVVSGSANLVHPHTLIMIAAAANAVEKQLRIIRRNKELARHINMLDSIIEAASPALMVLDKDLNIVRINQRGKRILGISNLLEKPVNFPDALHLDLNRIRRNPGAWIHRECRITFQGRDIHFLFNAQPVISAEQEIQGVVISFEEIKTIRKLADNFAGTRAFYQFDHLLGSSKPFITALDLARRATHTNVTVLLQGETGTGKELFAQAIHNEGPRRNNAFVAINCSAIPGELLESELFGYVDGAFTGAKKGGRPGKFELAHGGTLLLDEIGDMPHHMQAKLLRVLQTGEICRIGAHKPMHVDTRIIASTHVNLSKAVENGRFREDLYYRLNVFPIVIPPLRERGEMDIMTLAEFFLKKISTRTCRLTPNATQALKAHSWPGNVRELENAIQRAQHLSEQEDLDAVHLGLAGTTAAHPIKRPGTLEDVEREIILAALKDCGKNMATTAKKLGISRSTLYRKVKQYRL